MDVTFHSGYIDFIAGAVQLATAPATQQTPLVLDGENEEEVDLEQSGSDMVGQRDSGSAHCDKENVKIKENISGWFTNWEVLTTAE